MENKFKAGDKIRRNNLPLEKSYYDRASSFSNTLIEDRIYTVDVTYISQGLAYVYILEEDGKNCFHPEDIFELYEEPLSKVIVVNPTDKAKYAEEFDRLTEPKESIKDTVIDVALESIYIKDKEFFLELELLIIYLASTYNDKYESTDNYSKNKLLSKEGKAANVFTALKYIQRYDTVGYSKSENPQDLLKSIHYLLFENQRKNKHGN